MKSGLRRHMESLSRTSLAELLQHVSVMLKEFDGSPHLSHKQEALLMAAVQSLDAAVAQWTDTVELYENTHGVQTLPTLQPLAEAPLLAQDCIIELFTVYTVLKESTLTHGQVQRLMIAAYNLLVVGRTVKGSG
jgi:hypothetical protein